METDDCSTATTVKWALSERYSPYARGDACIGALPLEEQARALMHPRPALPEAVCAYLDAEFDVESIRTTRREYKRVVGYLEGLTLQRSSSCRFDPSGQASTSRAVGAHPRRLTYASLRARLTTVLAERGIGVSVSEIVEHVRSRHRVDTVKAAVERVRAGRQENTGEAPVADLITSLDLLKAADEGEAQVVASVAVQASNEVTTAVRVAALARHRLGRLARLRGAGRAAMAAEEEAVAAWLTGQRGQTLHLQDGRLRLRRPADQRPLTPDSVATAVCEALLQHGIRDADLAWAIVDDGV